MRIFAHDDQLHRFARALVGHAHHGALQNAGHLCHHVFHLVGVHVEAADQHHVFLAIDNFEIAARIHGADVAAFEIAIRRHDLGSFVWALPVACHHLGTFDGDFARLAQFGDVVAVVIDQLHERAGHGHANRAGVLLGGHRVA